MIIFKKIKKIALIRDFVKITDEERYLTNGRWNEYLSLKVVYSKLWKAKTQGKQVKNNEESMLDTITKFKDKISNDSKVENKKDKRVKL